MSKLWKFFAEIWGDWLARMSGPLTVPFTILAFFVSSTAYRSLFAVLTVIAAMVTCYRVWAKEYARAETEKAKNEAAPHMDIRVQNAIPYSSTASGVTDLFFYLELVLAEPSEVLIQNFSLKIFDQAHSDTFVAVEDLHEWKWSRKEGVITRHVPCEPMIKELKQRGHPTLGWIHFNLPNLSNSAIQRSALRLNVNCQHGTCYYGIQAANVQSDPDTKGAFRKVHQRRRMQADKTKLFQNNFSYRDFAKVRLHLPAVTKVDSSQLHAAHSNSSSN